MEIAIARRLRLAEVQTKVCYTKQITEGVASLAVHISCSAPFESAWSPVEYTPMQNHCLKCQRFCAALADDKLRVDQRAECHKVTK